MGTGDATDVAVVGAAEAVVAAAGDVAFVLAAAVVLLLLQLPLMFDTVDTLHNILKHGCDAGGNLCAICFAGPICFGGWSMTYGGSCTLADGCGAAHASVLVKSDQVPRDVTLLYLTSTTANATF